MQSKEVDARLEINEDRVLPLRLQGEFVYRKDVEVLKEYYGDLWRAYIFVSPDVFEDALKCKAIVDAFCQRYGIPESRAYRKVRTHNFEMPGGVTIKAVVHPLKEFLDNLLFSDIPSSLMSKLLAEASDDKEFLAIVKSGADPRARLSNLLDVSILKSALTDPKNTRQLGKKDRDRIQKYCNDLLAGSKSVRMAALSQAGTSGLSFDTYVDELFTSVTEMSESHTKHTEAN